MILSRTVKLLIHAAGQSKPQVPEAGRLLWTWFIDLGNARQYGMNGPQPISHSEIEAYARLHRLPIRPDHARALRQIDDAWLAQAYRSVATGKPKDGVKILPPASTHAISPHIFDAVM